MSALQLSLPPDLTAMRHTAMATEWVFHLGGQDPDLLQQAADEAFRLIDQLESTLSFYRESSDITCLNRAEANSEIMVSPDTLACLTLAAEVATLSQGAFDPFTGRATLAVKNQPIPLHLADAPNPAANDLAGPVLQLSPTERSVHKLRAGPWLDLGALGKGYALDQAAAVLAEWDVPTGCLVAGGSSLRGFGRATWSLTLGSKTLCLPNEFCLGASGFSFQPDHIIDPRPVATRADTARAVVSARTAALADGLSTAAMLMSPSELTALSQAQPAISALVIDRQGQSTAYGPLFA